MFVRVSHLSFSFSDSVAIIRDANFQIATGFTGIVGPNGAGKTTLMRLIAGELKPSSGSVHFDGASTAILLPKPSRLSRPKSRASRLRAMGKLVASSANWR